MGEPFERFKLSTAAEQLAEEAGHELNCEKPLPRKVGEDGVDTGAKGLQYDWLPSHQQLWVQVSKDRVSSIDQPVNGSKLTNKDETNQGMERESIDMD